VRRLRSEHKRTNEVSGGIKHRICIKIATTTGSTMVMVTHDVDEAVLLSDCIVMMTNGPSATSLRCACRARANGSRGRQICCT
jgi:ABC-type taurine transport system ATPase subunit